MAWNEKATGYTLAEDLEIRQPTNEEAAALGKNGSILAVVTGTHFVPGGLSRNKRYYPESAPYGFLWGEQLKKPWVVEKMTNNTMCGTIGHDLEVGEKEFREEKVSHFTKTLKIVPTGDPNKPYKGYAESYILNTAAGRALKTYLDAGMRLYVSSRADGDFLPGVTYKVAEDGSEVPVLDPSKFRLERFDFVFNPGFYDAKPELRESLGVTEGLLKSMNEAYQECEKQLSENFIKENTMSGATGNELINKSAGDVVIQVSDDNRISINKVSSVPNAADGTEAPHNKGATATSATNKDGAAEVDFDDKGQNTLTEEMIAAILKQNEELKAQVRSLQEAVASDAKPDINDMTKSMLAKNLKKIDPQGIVGDGLKNGGGSRDDLVASIKKIESCFEEVGAPLDVKEIVEGFWDITEAYGGVDGVVEDILFHQEYGSPEELSETINTTREFHRYAGTPDRLLDTVYSCNETLRVIEQFGEPDDVVAEIQGKREFCEDYGDLDSVAQELDEQRAFFEECGAPNDIRRGMAMLESINTRMNRFKELGVGSVEDMRVVLEELNDIKVKNQALAIAEHTGLDSKKVEEHLRKGMDEKQIVDLYNKSADNYYGRYLTVREDNAGSHLDNIPLKTVDNDGNHVQLHNASYKIDPSKNTSILEMALSGVTNTRIRTPAYRQ